MADYYFDASAVVKKYVLEPGSQFVSDVLDPTGVDEGR